MASIDSFVEQLIAERLVAAGGSIASGGEASLWRVNASAEEVAAAARLRSEFAGSHLLVLEQPSQDLVTVCVQFDKNAAMISAENDLHGEESNVRDAFSMQHIAKSGKSGPHSCEVCAAMFNTQEGLERHMCTHTGVFPFTCEICSRGFVRKYRLQKHMVVHSGERAFRCEICEKQFAQKNVLDRHMLVHGEKMQFKCPICEAVYSREDNLKRHVIKHNQGNVDETHIEKYLDEMRFPQAGKTLYRCGVCGKVVLRRSDLRRHLAVHPEEVAAAKKILTGGVFCELTTSGQGVQQDGEEDSKTAAITVLMEDFGRPEKQGNVTYCEICSAGFCTLEGLQRHMCTHTGIFPFRCEYCGQGFVKKYRLQKHIVIHTGERPFQCDVCLKGFAQKNVLARHRLTHVETTSFPCRICGGSFGRKDNLKKHMILKHINQGRDDKNAAERYLDSQRLFNGNRPFYRCKFCLKEFRKRCNLRRHLTSHSTKVAAQTADSSDAANHSASVLFEKCDICQEPFPEHSTHALHFRCIRGEQAGGKLRTFVKSVKSKGRKMRVREKAKRVLKVRKQLAHEELLSSGMERNVILTAEDHHEAHRMYEEGSTIVNNVTSLSIEPGADDAEQMIHIIVSDGTGHDIDFDKSNNDSSLVQADHKICFLLTGDSGMSTCEGPDQERGEFDIKPQSLNADHDQTNSFQGESSDWAVQSHNDQVGDVDGVYNSDFSRSIEHVALQLNIDDGAAVRCMDSSNCSMQLRTDVGVAEGDSESVIYLSISAAEQDL